MTTAGRRLLSFPSRRSRRMTRCSGRGSARLGAVRRAPQKQHLPRNNPGANYKTRRDIFRQLRRASGDGSRAWRRREWPSPRALWGPTPGHVILSPLAVSVGTVSVPKSPLKDCRQPPIALVGKSFCNLMDPVVLAMLTVRIHLGAAGRLIVHVHCLFQKAASNEVVGPRARPTTYRN